MLQFSELKKRNLLSNESMSNVLGGQNEQSGTCGYQSSKGTVCGISKSDALAGAAEDGHWCCDSCWSSSYCNNVIEPAIIEGSRVSDFV